MNKEGELMNKILIVSGMSCQHCVKRITQAFKEIDVDVKINLEERKVYLSSKKTVEDNQIIERFDDLGYEIESIL